MRSRFWGFGILGFWVLGFWGFGVFGFLGFGVLGFGVLGLQIDIYVQLLQADGGEMSQMPPFEPRHFSGVYNSGDASHTPASSALPRDWQLSR